MRMLMELFGADRKSTGKKCMNDEVGEQRIRGATVSSMNKAIQQSVNLKSTQAASQYSATRAQGALSRTTARMPAAKLADHRHLMQTAFCGTGSLVVQGALHRP